MSNTKEGCNAGIEGKKDVRHRKQVTKWKFFLMSIVKVNRLSTPIKGKG